MFPIMSTLFMHSQDTTAKNNLVSKIIQIHSSTDCFLLYLTIYKQVLRIGMQRIQVVKKMVLSFFKKAMTYMS